MPIAAQDGYKLGTFRIPKVGPPVLLLHGISLCSTCWVVNDPEQSLAFILSDAGAWLAAWVAGWIASYEALWLGFRVGECAREKRLMVRIWASS